MLGENENKAKKTKEKAHVCLQQQLQLKETVLEVGRISFDLYPLVVNNNKEKRVM
jgi:hypothetical protein